MTVKLFRELEQRFTGLNYSNSNLSLKEMLKEAEESKKQGFILSKEEVFSLFKRNDE